MKKVRKNKESPVFVPTGDFQKKDILSNFNIIKVRNDKNILSEKLEDDIKLINTVIDKYAVKDCNDQKVNFKVDEKVDIKRLINFYESLYLKIVSKDIKLGNVDQKDDPKSIIKHNIMVQKIYDRKNLLELAESKKKFEELLIFWSRKYN